MDSEKGWEILLGIQRGIGEIQGQIGRIEGMLPSLAKREEISQAVSLHTADCPSRRKRKTVSLMPVPVSKIDWGPVIKGLGKVLGALATLIGAAAAGYHFSR